MPQEEQNQILRELAELAPTPMNADDEVVSELSKAFPWADQRQLEWVSEHVSCLASKMARILDAKQRPRRMDDSDIADFREFATWGLVFRIVGLVQDNLEAALQRVDRGDGKPEWFVR
jgi:hypothetical protein